MPHTVSQLSRFDVLGERTNTKGSKKKKRKRPNFRALLLESDRAPLAANYNLAILPPGMNPALPRTVSRYTALSQSSSYQHGPQCHVHRLS